LIRALVRRQGSAANPVLFAEVNNPDPAVAQAAFRALSKTALAADVPALLKQLGQVRDADVRAEAESAAGQALEKIDDAASRSQAVFEAVRSSVSPDARVSFVALLPRCGDAEALKALIAAERNPDAQVREAAVRALTEWPDMEAWEVLFDHYRQGANETVRGLALQGLVRLAGEENPHPDAKLIERYRQLIDGARGDADLRLILGGLGGAADPGFLQLALPLLANASIRPEAEAAVKRIAESIKAKHPEAAQEALLKIQAK
jgi:HEAT repeat protein